MKKNLLLLLFFSLPVLSFGQFKERLEIDSLFAQWDNDQSPGAAIGIIKEGKLVTGQAKSIEFLPRGRVFVFKFWIYFAGRNCKPYQWYDDQAVRRKEYFPATGNEKYIF